VYLKELTAVGQKTNEIRDELARALRCNGSICRATFDYTRKSELAERYGKRNDVIPLLLGKEPSRMADLSLFPILFTVSQAAKSMAPNNVLLGLLAGQYAIGPKQRDVP
jgi:hypothetical protein